MTHAKPMILASKAKLLSRQYLPVVGCSSAVCLSLYVVVGLHLY